MEITINIPDSDIIDYLSGALEGGSNYWYNLPDLSMLTYTEEDLATNIFESVNNDHDLLIPVHDIETNDFLGYISYDNISCGLSLYLEENGFDNLDYMDACDYDLLFQYIVMGEIIYG